MGNADPGVAQPQQSAKTSGSSVSLIVGVLILVVAGGVAAWWMRAAPRETALGFVPADSQLVGVVQLRTLIDEIPALQRMMAQLYFSGGVNWKGEYGVAGRDLFDEAAIGGRFESGPPELTVVTRSRVPFERERALAGNHAGFATSESPNSGIFKRKGNDKFIGSVYLPDARSLVFSTGSEPRTAALTGTNTNHAAAAGPLIQSILDSPVWMAMMLDDPVKTTLRAYIPEPLAKALTPGRRIAVWLVPAGDRLEINGVVECPDSAIAKSMLDNLNSGRSQSIADLDAVASAKPDLKPMLEEIKGSLQIDRRDAQVTAKASASIASVETALGELAKLLKTRIPAPDQMFETPDGMMPRPKGAVGRG